MSIAAVPPYMMEGFNPTGCGMGGQTAWADVDAPTAKQIEIIVQGRSLKELEEDSILNGDSSSSALEFDGIIAQQSTTNKVTASATLTLDHIEEACELAFLDSGRPKIAVCSPAALRTFRKLIIDTYRYSPSDMNGETGLSFGVPGQIVYQSTIGPIVFFQSQYLSDTQGFTSGSRVVYLLDTDYIEMHVLQDMTYQELAKTNLSDKFAIYMFETLVCRAPLRNAWIGSIT